MHKSKTSQNASYGTDVRYRVCSSEVPFPGIARTADVDCLVRNHRHVLPDNRPQLKLCFPRIPSLLLLPLQKQFRDGFDVCKEGFGTEQTSKHRCWRSIYLSTVSAHVDGTQTSVRPRRRRHDVDRACAVGANQPRD